MVKKTDSKKGLKALKASLKRQYASLLKTAINQEKLKYTRLKNELKYNATLNTLSRKNVKEGCLYFRMETCGPCFVGKKVDFKPTGVFSSESQIRHKLSEKTRKDLPAFKGVLCIAFSLSGRQPRGAVLLNSNLTYMKKYLYHSMGRSCCVGDLQRKMEKLTLDNIPQVLAFLDEVIEMYKTPTLDECSSDPNHVKGTKKEKKTYGKLFHDAHKREMKKKGGISAWI